MEPGFSEKGQLALRGWLKLGRFGKAALSVSALLAAAMTSAPAAFAQGCALCYNDAAATGPQAQAALRHGILILMIPPMLMFSGLFGILYRRRNAHHEALISNAALDQVNASEFVLRLD